MSGFFTGFFNRASEINRDRDKQRNRNLEQAMERFSNTIERRREELRALQQQRQQARVLAASVPGINPADAEGFVAAGLFDRAMQGQFTPVGTLTHDADSPSPAPPATPSPTPAAGGGLGSPPQASPVVPQAASPQAQVATPQAAQIPQGISSPTPVADPREAVASEPQTVGQRITQTMFGRDPFRGVEEEVRDRYMRESGMTREQMDRLLAPPPEPSQITGRYQYNQFTPQQEMQMAGLFVDRAGYERARASGWRDLSGLATQTDTAQLQAMIRAAGAGAGAGNITSAFNAAVRAVGSVLPSIGGGILRQHIDPATGAVSIVVAVPSNDPRYAQAVQAQLSFMSALGTALRGEIPGVPSLDPGAAVAHAMRVANQIPGLGGRGTPAPSPTPLQPPSVAQARQAQQGGSPVAPNAPFQPSRTPSVAGASEIPAVPTPRIMERDGIRYENTGRVVNGRPVWRNPITGLEGTFPE